MALLSTLGRWFTGLDEESQTDSEMTRPSGLRFAEVLGYLWKISVKSFYPGDILPGIAQTSPRVSKLESGLELLGWKLA